MTVTRLQWGHDLLIVEGQSGCTMRVELLLQWGHDLLIVECRRRHQVEASRASFNGATIC